MSSPFSLIHKAVGNRQYAIPSGGRIKFCKLFEVFLMPRGGGGRGGSTRLVTQQNGISNTRYNKSDNIYFTDYG